MNISEEQFQVYKQEALCAVHWNTRDGGIALDGNGIQFILSCEAETVSRITDELLNEGLIKPHDTEAGYIPA